MAKEVKPIVLPEDFKVEALGHTFNVSIAKAFGLTEAILLQNFYHWHQCNKGNDDMFKDGRVWFFRSVAQIVECYPYLSPDKVRYAIERLIHSGFLFKGNYSEDKLKKASWYSLSDKTLSLFGENNIPFGKTQNDFGNSQLNYNNKDIDNNLHKEKEEDKSSSQKNQCVDYQAIFNTWNEVVANIEGISTITKMSEKRKKYISTLLKSCDTNVEEILRVIKTLPYADHWVTSKKAETEWSFSFDWFFTNTKNWFIRALEGDMHKKNAEIFKSIMAGEVPVSTPTESKDTITIGGIVYR